METLIDVVQNVGFPIAVCGALMWYITDLGDKHRAETKDFTDALNSNTSILQKLADKLDEVLR